MRGSKVPVALKICSREKSRSSEFFRHRIHKTSSGWWCNATLLQRAAYKPGTLRRGINTEYPTIQCPQSNNMLALFE